MQRTFGLATALVCALSFGTAAFAQTSPTNQAPMTQSNASAPAKTRHRKHRGHRRHHRHGRKAKKMATTTATKKPAQ